MRSACCRRSASLSPAQAMYHFISGYTAKVAGTEVGVKEPSATFSPCFGGPFLVWHPSKYAELLAAKMQQHKARVWLVNTGWSGGAHGVGKRIKLAHTRALLDAIHSGALAGAATERDPVFGFDVVTACPGVPSDILWPRDTWATRRPTTRRRRSSPGCSSTTSRSTRAAPVRKCARPARRPDLKVGPSAAPPREECWIAAAPGGGPPYDGARDHVSKAAIGFPAERPRTRIVVVGAGHVGAAFAYAALLRGLATELVLIDTDHARAEGEAMDLNHALPFTPPARIWAGSYADCAGAVATVLTAGVAQKPGETRLDLLRKNAAVFRRDHTGGRAP